MAEINLINSTLDGRYLITGQLGEGGMGAVYEARHLGTGRRVAVKVITTKLAQDEAVMARFEREARAAGAIDSEHIASVLDSGRDRATGLPFLVMELLSGEDVDHLLRRLGPLSPELALCVVAQACMGLQKAHDARVMHRDIKPANLFLARRDGGELTVKILDFGVAKFHLDETNEAQPELTATTNLIGSPIYMSPEQARNMKDVDFRTDLWSLGVVLYKMLAGRTPYRSSRGLGELIVSICSTPPAPIQSLAPWVPPQVAEIVHRALQIDRNERFQSAWEMYEAAHALLPRGHSIRPEMLAPISDPVARFDIPPSSSTRSGEPVSRRMPAALGTAPGWSEHVTPLSQSGPTARADSKSDIAPPSRTITSAPAPQLKSYLVDGNEPTPILLVQPKSRAAAIVAAAALVIATATAVGAWLMLKAAQPTSVLSAAGAMGSPGAVPQASASAGSTGSVEIDPERLASFGPLPSVVTSGNNPLTEEKIQLGRMLFYEPRLSRNHNISCSSCHPLDRYGADGTKVSIGHAHRSGRRNTPSVYNSAGFFSFMWDGRIDTLEQQASAPILNPDEMAMTETRVEATLRSMPDYVKAFAKAFPNDPWPVTLENTARAIAAFERKLFTRGRWDRFLEGDRDALTNAEKTGFNAFVETGCVTCHFGPHVGATMFQKLGLVRAWPDSMDRGRFEVTQRPADFMVFRVPSLRNVAATGPYFHDGSISSLNEAVRLMAKHQLGKDISPETVDSIVIWLKCLTGDIPSEYIAKPTLPESGPNTPPPIPE